MAREIDADKEDVADFVLQSCVRSGILGRGGDRIELDADFLDLLVQLGDHRRRPRPVEADRCRALLQFQRALPFGHAAGDAGQRAGILVGALRLAFAAFVQFPVAGLRFGVGIPRIKSGAGSASRGIGTSLSGKYVRMPAFHLVGDRFDHVGECESSPGLLGHARMEHDLKQQVAEFVAQVVHVATVDRVGNLVGFLDRVRRDRREGLLHVPWTASLRVAQARHDVEQQDPAWPAIRTAGPTACRRRATTGSSSSNPPAR